MKKSVSIIGSCISRNIFYTPQCQEVFDVDNYAFQMIPYSMFDEPWNVPYDILSEMEKRPFVKKTLFYNINKNVCQEFENKKTDYIVVDLLACSMILSEMCLNNKKTIVRIGQGLNSLESMKNNKWFIDNGFSYKLRNFSEIDYNYIINGLDKFIEWISSIYRKEQIVICRPYLPHKYIDENMNVVSYSESKIKCFKAESSNINELTEYLISKLKGCKVLDFSRNIIAEGYLFSEDKPFHYSNSDYLSLGDKMLELLDINVKEYYKYTISPESYVMETWVKKYFDARQMLIELEEKILGIKIKDTFIGTSIGNIYTRPFDENLYTVVEVCEKMKANENIWRERYEKLLKDYQMLAETIINDDNQRREECLGEYTNVYELLKKIQKFS